MRYKQIIPATGWWVHYSEPGDDAHDDWVDPIVCFALMENGNVIALDAIGDEISETGDHAVSFIYSPNGQPKIPGAKPAPEETAVDNMGLTLRAELALENQAGAKTAADVAKMRRQEILKLPNCGPKVLRDIEDRLAVLGLELKQ